MDMGAILAQIPERIRAQAESTTSKDETLADRYRRQVARLNDEPGDLTGYDCPECKNRGYFFRVRDNGERYVEDCRCIKIRRTMRYLKESGLEDLLKRCTFETWKCEKPWQKELLGMAQDYLQKGRGKWFLLSGRPGTGKTHICTAICGELMRRGYRTRYMLWRDAAVRAKAVITDGTGYAEMIDPYKDAKVLYIDDFLKTGKRGGFPTDGDVNLAFELINSRYNDRDKITIISSELTANALLEIDEAMGSRIVQKCGSYYADLSERENYRLAGLAGVEKETG